MTLLFTITALFLTYDYRRELDRRQRELASVSRLILEHGERSIEDGDKVLKAIVGPLSAWDQQDERQGRRIFDLVRNLMQGSPQVASVWICDANGRTILDSWTYPSSGASCEHREYLLERLRGEQGPRLQGADRGSVTSKPRFTFTRDVRNADGTLKFVAVVGIYSDYFADLYAAVFTERSMRGGLFLDLDATDFSLLTRLGSAPRASTTYTTQMLTRMRASPAGEGVITGENESRIGAWRRSQSYPHLFASTSIDLSDALSEWRRQALVFSSITIGCSLAFIGFSIFARRSFEARAQLRQQALIQREVYHRVKNNLQILASLVRRAARDENGTTQNPQLNLVANITAIAKVFDLLQVSPQGERVNLSELLQALANETAKATDAKIEVQCDASCWLDAHRATNLAIATNELVTNAVKHAHSSIRVACTVRQSLLQITVSDDGPGLVPSAEPERKGFGLGMVRTLAGQEGGKLEFIKTEFGGAAQITVPV